MKLTSMLIGLLAASGLNAQTYHFDFSTDRKTAAATIRVLPSDRYSEEKGYGYDLQPSPEKQGQAPFFFSVKVPDGNYRVTAVVGSAQSAGETTVRGESRRLFHEHIVTRKKEWKTLTFVINKRNTRINETEEVRI